MANKTSPEAVDELYRDLTGIDLPFGGKPILALGDFRQVAPVVRGASRTATFEAHIKSSYLWPHFTVFTLNHPFRFEHDEEYSHFIDTIGEGFNRAEVCLDLLEHVESIEDVADFLFPTELLADVELCLRRAFLSPLNVLVDDFNALILSRLSGDVTSYFSHDEIHEEDAGKAATHPLSSPDMLSSLSHPGVPSHQLDLKPGAVCLLMRNMSTQKGLVKNARVVIQSLHRRFVAVQLIRNNFLAPGQIDSEIHCIPRILFDFKPTSSSWTVRRRQFPLRLAYATTFNSCQGLTLDRIVLDLRTEVFAHGQLYTAVSRIRDRTSGKVLTTVDTIYTKNVVYKELLLDA